MVQKANEADYSSTNIAEVLFKYFLFIIYFLFNTLVLIRVLENRAPSGTEVL